MYVLFCFVLCSVSILAQASVIFDAVPWRAPTMTDAWPMGSLCIIDGLKSEAGQLLNGRLGEDGVGHAINLPKHP